MDRRSAIVLALAACSFRPGAALAQTATPAPNMAPLNNVEDAFYRRASAVLRHRYPNPDAAERAGYFRYTNEDRTGAISYENPNYFNTPEVEHPQQLWFDVKGRLLGADFSQTVAAFPEPTLFGLQKVRYHHIPLHVHYGLRNTDGTFRYGLFVRADDFRNAGLDPLKPTAADLVKLGKATAPVRSSFVYRK
jgi:hypothetical protein